MASFPWPSSIFLGQGEGQGQDQRRKERCRGMWGIRIRMSLLGIAI